MKIVHFSSECYPAAKAGGLGDVVGSLPKYLNLKGQEAEVVIPKYHNQWMNNQLFETVATQTAQLGNDEFHFSVERLKGDPLGFPLLVIDIPGRFDRPGVYIDPWSGHGYWDELERFMSFQIAGLSWLNTWGDKPDIIHCHDHHTALIPFMITQSEHFRQLRDIPTVVTVHNAEYHGRHEMAKAALLPPFNPDQAGLLEWEGQLNSLAAGLKTSWQVTTVSNTYMDELQQNSNGLEALFAFEQGKSRGIINGIDNAVWNPETDPLIEHNYSYRGRKSGKKKNKEVLCAQFSLNPELPTISFIGRLVREKGADLLPDLFRRFIYSDVEVNFVLLGTGDPQLHDIFASIKNNHVGFFDATLEYNERLAHQMYAGSDFILMPSRVEPCGLNQMFAMRYGTVPIVRSVGGLIDTVKDIDEEGGYGIRFDGFNLEDADYALCRAVNLYKDQSKMADVVSTIMKLDFSWDRSAREYIQMYTHLTNL
ncbi:MAG: glycogen/starch synthase [Bacteroidota bacterium]